MERLTLILPAPVEQAVEQSQSQKDPGWIVTVYNNETNTYEEVIMILMLATDCTTDEAYMETWEIDHLGKSVVHCASEAECQRAAEIIATIGIRVEATPDPLA